MGVTRITEFRARADHIAPLRAFLTSIVPGIASSAGCASCQLLQGHDDPARFLVVEVWDSVASHQASVRAIPPEDLARVSDMLDGPPRGDYFDA